jgi:hypothetical protein
MAIFLTPKWERVKMHFCYVLDTNNVFLTCCTVHCQNIYNLSKQSGIETFLAVAVRVMGWMRRWYISFTITKLWLGY